MEIFVNDVPRVVLTACALSVLLAGCATRRQPHTVTIPRTTMSEPYVPGAMTDSGGITVELEPKPQQPGGLSECGACLNGLDGLWRFVEAVCGIAH